MEFAPAGYIGLLDAKHEIMEQQFPGYRDMSKPLSDRKAIKEMNEVFLQRDREAGKRLIDAFMSDDLICEFEYPKNSSKFRIVPKWYLRNKQLMHITLGSGRMELQTQIINGWADFHLAPCFIKRPAFDAWLGIAGRGRKTELESRRIKVLNEFDRLCDAGKVSFKHGGLAKVARELYQKFPMYKSADSIRKIIQPFYKEKKNKENSPPG